MYEDLYLLTENFVQGFSAKYHIDIASTKIDYKSDLFQEVNSQHF